MEIQTTVLKNQEKAQEKIQKKKCSTTAKPTKSTKTTNTIIFFT